MIRTGTLFTFGILTQAVASAAPYNYQGNTYSSDGQVLRNLQENVERIRHGQHNQENQIKELDQKFETIEAIIDSLRKQLQNNAKTHKENITSTTSQLEIKIGDLELAIKSALADLQQIKDHANKTTNFLTQYQQKLRDIEQVNHQQSQQIDSLQNAIKSIIEVVSKEGEKPGVKIYRVKSGDSLEKIAQAHQTTVKAIKELNNLPDHDRIIINQKLKIPEN